MIQAATPALVLASGSATRRMVLEQAGLVFTVRPPDVDEQAIKRRLRLDPVESVALALANAKAASDGDSTGSIIVGADQILVCGDQWYDKPADLSAAASHLRALRCRSHTLITAVVCWRDGICLWQHVATPALTMRAVSDEFIEAYLLLEGSRCLSSVGAYRLEGPGIHLFSHIDGEQSTILGLPMLPLLGFLREQGLIAE